MGTGRLRRQPNAEAVGRRREPGRLQELTQFRELLRSMPEGAEVVEPCHGYLARLWASAEKRDPPRAEVIRDIYMLAAKCGSRR